MKYLRWILSVCGAAVLGAVVFTAPVYAATSFSCSFTCTVAQQVNEEYVYYYPESYTETITYTENNVGIDRCSARNADQQTCLGLCKTTCHGRVYTPTGTIVSGNGEKTCIGYDPVPDFIFTSSDRVRDNLSRLPPVNRDRYERAMTSDRRSLYTAPDSRPRCAATGATTAAASQCTESTNIQNDQQGKCVFYCIRPEAGTGGTVERRETPLPQLRNGATVPGGTTTTSCRRGSLERREGTNACAVGSVCGCQQECMTTCGNASDGKSLCYMGTDNTRSVDLCRDNVSSEAATPICSRDPNAPVRGSQHTLTNPLGTSSIAAIVARIVKAVTGIVGSVALLMFVVAGIMWMTAESSDRVDMAKTIFKNASFGLVLIFFSYSLVSLLLSILGL